MNIVTRAEWGARDWTRQPSHVLLSERREFFVHYHGGIPPEDTGVAVPREVESIHVDGNGWSGTGYAFMVDQAGTIFEGRGWSLQAAHCPGYNRSGLSAYVAIGGDQEPTDAALRAVRWLYDESCRRTGRQLAKRGHRDGKATSCPGDALYAWVEAGMPEPGPVKVAAGMPEYPVKPGDTLSEIAAEAYRDGTAWPTILHANPRTLGGSAVIYVGMTLWIPDEPTHWDRPAAPAPPLPPAPTPVPAPPPVPVPPLESEPAIKEFPVIHVYAEGAVDEDIAESLLARYRVAAFITGDVRAARELFDAETTLLVVGAPARDELAAPARTRANIVTLAGKTRRNTNDLLKAHLEAA